MDGDIYTLEQIELYELRDQVAHLEQENFEMRCFLLFIEHHISLGEKRKAELEKLLHG